MANPIPCKYRDYLRDHAYFFCPEDVSGPTGTANVDQLAAERLRYEWKVTEARHDPSLVNSLIKFLDTFLGQSPGSIEGWGVRDFEQAFQSKVKNYNKCRKENIPSAISNEANVRHLLSSGPFSKLEAILPNLGYPLYVDGESTLPVSKAKVDFEVLTHRGRKGLIEAESPSVLNRTEAKFFVPNPSRFQIKLADKTTSNERRVINKACFYMGSYEVEWLALTSYTKWVFLRLHCGTAPDPTYVTYSTVEAQSDNTRPFRALLGMMLAIATDTAVPSNASAHGPLQVIPEDEEDPEDEGARGNGESGPFDSEQQDEGKQSKATSGERQQTRSMTKQDHSASLSTIIHIAWSEEVTPGARWLTFHAGDTNGFPGLGNIKLRLQRSIGQGSTGIVYEAIPEEDEPLESSKRRRYAIKAVTKGETEEERSALQRLRNELRIYRKIEQRQSKQLEELSQIRRSEEIRPYSKKSQIQSEKQSPGLFPDLQVQSEMSSRVYLDSQGSSDGIGMFSAPLSGFGQDSAELELGSPSPKIAPQCYGLFETTQTLALVMDCEGDVLSHDVNWPELTHNERHELYDAILALHRLGVYHGDLEPRNILRDSNGSYKIIDFSSSKLHDCLSRTCPELVQFRKKLGISEKGLLL